MAQLVDIVALMTEDEKQMVIDHAKGAAFALAGFWDVLRILETKYHVEIDDTVDAIDTFAADLGAPAQMSDMDNMTIEEVFSMMNVVKVDD